MPGVNWPERDATRAYYCPEPACQGHPWFYVPEPEMTADNQAHPRGSRRPVVEDLRAVWGLPDCPGVRDE